MIEKRGAFYSYAEQRIGQGRENAKDTLKASPELAWEIELAIRQATDLVGSLAPPEPEGDSDYAEGGAESTEPVLAESEA